MFILGSYVLPQQMVLLEAFCILYFSSLAVFQFHRSSSAPRVVFSGGPCVAEKLYVSLNFRKITLCKARAHDRTSSTPTPARLFHLNLVGRSEHQQTTIMADAESLQEMEPSPVEETPSQLKEGDYFPDSSSSKGTHSLGLSGSHSALYYLQRIQRYSTYAFSAFAVAHVRIGNLDNYYIPLANHRS